MAYEHKGEIPLDKILEAKKVLTGEYEDKDYIIPADESWCILSFSGSSSISEAEIEFMFSYDGGDTWFNPYDPTNDIIRCLHISNVTPVSISNSVGLIFDGDGVDTIFRIRCKNLNAETADEVVGWINGFVM